ncbi:MULTISPECIES: TRAP transporter large permease [Chelatococcus]|uniref:TRAP transporter large permease protein n=1 Tax=Chelatococcus caeni TaxID=1348468 RepID=A0A840C4J2_9HYPH|nr:MULTISPECIES: TRAP transporter large permease [Chelatococcus]ALA20480.1 C4-dicarboxylate ABC transporter permease [Chelatococcus sp. CO-6]MBB4018538.1 tripartite ATP-independent transporter DctM subunit [Chelatococcus caeni]
MSDLAIGALALVGMIGLIYAGMHVAMALALCSFLGVFAMKGNMAVSGRMLALAATESIESYIFGVVPLFVLMGFVVSQADIGRDAFDVANRLIGRVKGGLGIATVGANAIFAAITGISIASAAVFTRVAVPEMLRHGYSKRFAYGIVAGSSVLGMLIPPSLLLILYGVLTEQSVGDLFLAGVVPGIILAIAFGIGVYVMARRWPAFAGGEISEEVTPLSAIAMTGKAAPIVLLIALVLGGIYGGFFTPTEAGAVGALGAVLIGFARRALPPGRIWRVLTDTGQVTAAICFLIIAASMYSRMLSLSGLPEALSGMIAASDIGYWGIVLAYVALVIAMGMLLDSSSIMLIVIPLFMPIMKALAIDPIWFGIITVLAVEVGLLTPPFGLSVYVIKGTSPDRTLKLGEIFAGSAPFAAIMLAVIALILVFPGLATGLVGR